MGVKDTTVNMPMSGEATSMMVWATGHAIYGIKFTGAHKALGQFFYCVSGFTTRRTASVKGLLAKLGL